MMTRNRGFQGRDEQPVTPPVSGPRPWGHHDDNLTPPVTGQHPWEDHHKPAMKSGGRAKRKSGGSTMTAGAGSGEGRLQKAAWYGAQKSK